MSQSAEQETSQAGAEGAVPKVVQATEKSRFEVHVGGQRAGTAYYRDLGEQRVFHHTEVAAAFEGQGLAGTMVRCALDQTRAQGKRVVAVCPYVSVFVKRNHDWDDLLDPVTPQVIEALEP